MKNQFHRKKSLHRKSIVLINILFFLSVTGITAQEVPIIAKEALKKHVYHLASPELEGRETGKPGQKLAAHYIDSVFSEAGLATLCEGSYFQPFCLYKTTQEKIIFQGVRSYETAWSMVGNGNTVPDSASFVFAGNRKMDYSHLMTEEQFIILEPENLRNLSKLIKHYQAAKPAGYLVVMEQQKLVRATLRKNRQVEALRLDREPEKTKFDKKVNAVDPSVKAFVRPEQFRNIFGITTEQAYSGIEKGKRPKAPYSMTHWPKLELVPAKLDSLETENLIGMIAGDKRPEEFIVVTAHYDHVGIGSKGVNAGADDNASGTAALMEMAKGISAYKAAGHQLDRSILFAAVSAEELGLFGSAYFVTSPEFKDLNGVLNINMDMIGKSIRYNMIEAFRSQAMGGFVEDTTARESYVYLMKHGAGTRKLARKSKQAAKQYDGFVIDQRPGFLVRITFKHSSDHKNFHKRGIPVMVYFTGLHPDYHTPGDTPEKIDYENLCKITNIIIHTLIESANP